MISIRDARMSDCDSIAEIYNLYLGIASMDLEPKDGSYYSSWLNKKSDRECMMVSCDKEKVVAWGIIKKYSDRVGYQYAAETSVYVTTLYQNQKIGSNLKMKLITKAKELHYRHLVAKIWANNRVSIDYNLKMGYELVGVQKKIGYVNDQWIDVAILQLVL